MKFLRIILSGFLIFSAVFSIFFGKGILQTGEDKNPKEYKAVLTVWQIDIFEGGKGSRRQFIESVSKRFEKQNLGVFVLVSSLSPSGAKERMEKGEFPDIISFGFGVDIPSAKEIDLSVSGFGKVGGTTYAVPWCRGGYALIENPESKSQKTVISQQEFTQPLISASINGVDLSKGYEIKTPMDAYIDFVSGGARYLVGTQRDIARLETRGMSVMVKPLGEFSDLYQYLAITDSSDYLLGQSFIEFMTSEFVQNRLNEIYMFSDLYPVKYDGVSMSEMQSKKITVSISPFMDGLNAKEIQSLSLKAIGGDKNAENKIKNMLSYLENNGKI